MPAPIGARVWEHGLHMPLTMRVFCMGIVLRQATRRFNPARFRAFGLCSSAPFGRAFGAGFDPSAVPPPRLPMKPRNGPRPYWETSHATIRPLHPPTHAPPLSRPWRWRGCDLDPHRCGLAEQRRQGLFDQLRCHSTSRPDGPASHRTESQLTISGRPQGLPTFLFGRGTPALGRCGRELSTDTRYCSAFSV